MIDSRTLHNEEEYVDPGRYGRQVDLEKLSVMDAERLVELCVKNDGYCSPELNDQLLLHNSGFTTIPPGVLDPYYNCRTLFFQANGLRKIENLRVMPGLRALYLQDNCISQIQNLTCLQELMVLNLSNNKIDDVPPHCLPHSLEQVNLSRNLLAKIDHLEGIFECPKLSSVDVSYNCIEESDQLVESWEHLPLDCLFLHHNPGLNKLKNYRRKIISSMPTLRFLDERPVDALERCGAEAWSRGEDEMAAKGEMWTKEMEAKRRSFEVFRKIQEVSARKGLERQESERKFQEKYKLKRDRSRERKESLRAAAEAQTKEMEKMEQEDTLIRAKREEALDGHPNPSMVDASSSCEPMVDSPIGEKENKVMTTFSPLPRYPAPRGKGISEAKPVLISRIATSQLDELD